MTLSRKQLTPKYFRELSRVDCGLDTAADISETVSVSIIIGRPSRWTSYSHATFIEKVKFVEHIIPRTATSLRECRTLAARVPARISCAARGSEEDELVQGAVVTSATVKEGGTIFHCFECSQAGLVRPSDDATLERE
jgi:hypothetical protein